MGVDLSLLPANSRSNNCDISNDVLSFHRDSDLFKII